MTLRVGNARRELAYDSDVLGHMPWETLAADRLAVGWRPAAQAPHEQRFRVDLGILKEGEDIRTSDAAEMATLDRVFIARAIGDLIPNSWLAFDLVDRVIRRLLNDGHREERIAASGALLIEQLRADIVAQRDALAQQVFEGKVHSGEIEFQLRADRNDYEIPLELDVDLPEKPAYLLRDGKPVEKSLFNPFYDTLADNAFESDFAWYLDKVYPDFVFLRTERDGKPVLVVMETKGAHLKNEDTDYKQKLLAALTAAYGKADFTRAGELELAGRDGPRVVCDLVFDENWKNTLNTRHFAGDAAAGSDP